MCALESDYRYDHATPLDTEGTLGRALASLSILGSESEFTVAVVAASTREEIKQAVELKVRSIVAQFEYDFPIFLIGPDELVVWRRRLMEKGMDEYDQFLSLDGYSNIRNMCLLGAVLTDADVAVLFDDDQIYEDPGYLEKAREFIGRQHEGRFVGGVAGYYRHAWDSHELPGPKAAWQLLWGSIGAMNQAFRLIERPPRLKRTPFVFGGNMVIHRELFTRIPFDPTVPRGEDIDYLINCRLFDHEFFLDNELWIRHLPPPKCAPEWLQMRQDIIRFARERAKLASQPARKADRVKAEDFDPYPGRFLKDDLHDLVFSASLEMASAYISAGKEEDARECMVNIAISKAENLAREDVWGNYLAYQRQWEKFIRVLPGLGIWSPAANPD
ncbi:MAG: hypothetical protein IBX61_08570 [Thermoleophilia bacterium]|nr:hypothetical protein [Thermoleophilia bacterium]